MDTAIQGLLTGFAIALGILFGAWAGNKSGDDMCRQWGGKSAIVYEGKCMVPTESGGLRPARRDE